MHVKHIHCMVEKLAEYGKCMIEAGAGEGNVNISDAGQIVDMIKDLCEAEKDALIAKEMKKCEEEDEAEEKYFLKMLKDEYKDEFKRMKDEYGEDEGERRFYDNYRYKTSGRFAPKGSGSYMPRSSGKRSGRRGYEEMVPVEYLMTPEMMHEHDPEYWRDMDRKDGKMYYTDANPGGNSGSAGRTGNMSSGNVRGYSEGYDEGSRRGYEQGYSDAAMNAKKFESRYDNVKRNYTETKAAHKGNTPEDKQLNMKEMEKVLNVVFDEIDEMLEGASPEVKNMVKTKGLGRFQKIS